jgi:nicotinamide riboside kinase
MEVVTGAMSTLLPKLADLIKDEYNLQKSVRAEITFLKTELEYMEAALTMVSEAPIDQQPPNRLVKLWTRDVRELSYDLEDSIDAFMVHIANDSHVPTKAKKHSFRAFMERSMNLLRRGKIRHNIGVDVEEYKKRVKEVKERSDRYSKVDNIGAKPLAPSVDVHRLSALYTKATDLVGTKQKSDELVNKLLMKGDEASKHHLKVLSIVGFGGLGKTTLARTVYENLRKRFDCGAFVTVSHNPDIKNILSNILQGCGHLKYDPRWDEIQLINELRDFLRDKRYVCTLHLGKTFVGTCTYVYLQCFHQFTCVSCQTLLVHLLTSWADAAFCFFSCGLRPLWLLFCIQRLAVYHGWMVEAATLFPYLRKTLIITAQEDLKFLCRF